MTADRRLPSPLPPAFFGPLGPVPFGGGEGVGNPSRAVSAWGGRRCRIWSLLLAARVGMRPPPSLCQCSGHRGFRFLGFSPFEMGQY